MGSEPEAERSPKRRTVPGATLEWSKIAKAYFEEDLIWKRALAPFENYIQRDILLKISVSFSGFQWPLPQGDLRTIL